MKRKLVAFFNSSNKFILTFTFSIIIGLCLFDSGSIFAADLKDIYSLYLEEDQFLSKSEIYFYRNNEKGQHGSASFDHIEAYPDYFSLFQSFRFSSFFGLDVDLGYSQTLPAEYSRAIYNPAGSLAALYHYNLTYFKEYNLDLRKRVDPFEFYFSINDKRQRSQWTYSIAPADPNYNAYLSSYYDDIKFGARFLSNANASADHSVLSYLKLPLLDDSQFNLETELRYRSGRLSRIDSYDVGSVYTYNYLHQLRAHYTPKVTFSYGVKENLQLTSGFAYTTPYKYKYEYIRINPSATTQIITGTYQFDENYEIPMNLIYRPRKNWELAVSSDFTMAKQRLDYWEKATDNTVTTYSTKKLRYYNTKPTLQLTYLHEANVLEKKREGPLFLLKKMLGKNQFLVELAYEWDITKLNKGASNGSQNFIDPYDIFLYPGDLFVGGTEYAVFNYGGNASSAANVKPQNYHAVDATFTYGINDSLNLGVGMGYNAGSSLQHFTLKDRSSLYYKFEPYYYFDVSGDWHMTKNGLLSCNVHIVPAYKTFLDSSSQPQRYESENKYLEAIVSLQFLF